MSDKAIMAGGRRALGLPLTTLALLIVVLLAGCSSSPAAPAAQTATATAAPSTVLPAATTAPASGATTSPTTATAATAPITGTVPVTATTVEGTPTARPTPSGAAPDPFNVLNVFDIVTPGSLIIKRDILPLDGKEPDNVLATITGARLGVTAPLTEETTSALGVMTYDPVYREWNLTWQSVPISGTARPLPASNQFGGTNGGDLLRTGSPILELRTTTLDGAAHLQLLRYDRNTHTATPLKMVPTFGADEQDALFNAELDVNVADLDDDGVYEVVADNVSGVLTWRWDGTKFEPRGIR